MNQLWLARKTAAERGSHGVYIHPIHIDDEISRINENMADVLKENGIKPRKLIVTYQTTNCEKCSFYDGQFCTDEFSYPDQCKYKTTTRTISFYGFSIDNDYLEGITAEFIDVRLDLLKVIDTETNEVLYEYEKEEEN